MFDVLTQLDQQPRAVRHQGRVVRCGLGRTVRRRGGPDQPDQGGKAGTRRRRRIAALHQDGAGSRVPVRRHRGRRNTCGTRSTGTAGRTAPATTAHRVLSSGRRGAAGLCGGGGGSAAGARRQLDDPPRLRHREPGVAALGARSLVTAHIHPLRRTWLWSIRLERNGFQLRRLDQRSGVRRRGARAGAVPPSRGIPRCRRRGGLRRAAPRSRQQAGSLQLLCAWPRNPSGQRGGKARSGSGSRAGPGGLGS